MPMIFDEEHPITMPDGETVWVKKRLSSGDESNIKAAAAAGSKMEVTAAMAERQALIKEALKEGTPIDDLPEELRNSGDETVVGTVDYETMLKAAEFASLDNVILRWTYVFPEGHPQAGKPVPVTPTFIRRLAPEDVNHLKRALNELYEEEVDDNTKVGSSMSVSAPS